MQLGDWKNLRAFFESFDDNEIKPVGSGFSGASPIAIKGAEAKPSLCSKTNFADGNSAPLTKPQPILR